MTTLRVVTANILKPDSGEPEFDWEHRRQLCVDALAQTRADVIGLQEARHNQVSDILAALPGYTAIGTPRTLPDGPPVNTIIYHTETLAARANSAAWLSATPWIPGSNSWQAGSIRLLQWVDFVHVSGQRFLHLNTHLDHASTEARTQAGRMIAQLITSLPADGAVVLTMDANATDNDPALDPLWDCGLTDAYADQLPAPATWYDFGRYDPAEHERIDWILHRGPWLTSSAATLIPSKLQDPLASDHSFVQVDLSWA